MYRPFFRAKGFATTTSELRQRIQALLKAFSGFEDEISEARAVRLFVSSPQRPAYWLELCADIRCRGLEYGSASLVA